jgi:WD40 repeat protein
MHQTTRDVIIQTGLIRCRAAGDFDQLLRTARSFRYWSLRLELNDPGPVDEELAAIAEPDVVALRCALRQRRRVLREPLGDWRLKGAVLLEQIEGVPALANMATQARDLLATGASAVLRSLRLTNRWSARQDSSPVRCRRLDGHDRAVTVCVMVRDHPWLVTGGGGEILIWDLDLGILRAIHTGDDASEMLAACSPPSGAWLATVQVPGGRLGQRVGRQSTMRIWDLRHGARSQILNDDSNGAYDCQLSPDGRWLVSHHCDHRAFFWDTQNWKLGGMITGQAAPAVRGVRAATCYAPDGSWFALANADGSVGLWDPATRKREHLLTGHNAQVDSLVAPQDSSWLAALSRGKLRVWDTRHGGTIRAVDTSATGCGGLIADPDGRWVAASFGTDAVRVIGVRTGGHQASHLRRAVDRMTRQRLAGSPPDSWGFSGAVCRSDRHGSRILSASAVENRPRDSNLIYTRHIVSCWDTATGNRIAGPTSRPGDLPHVVMQPDLEWGLTVSEDRVAFFDPTNAHFTTEFGYGHDRIRSMRASRRWLAVGFESGAVRLFQPSGASATPTTILEEAPAALEGCFAPPHGRWILVWSGRDAVVLDPWSGAIRCRLEGRNTGVFLNKVINACCFAPDGSWVATADDDGTVRVWDPENGQQRARVPGEDGEDFAARCVSADRMVTIGRDGQLRVRDQHAFLLGELSAQGMSRPSRACPVGHLGLAAEDGTAVHVWDLRSGRHQYGLPGERGAAALPPSRERPDGLLATIGPAGDVRLRDAATGQPRVTVGAESPDPRPDDFRVSAVHPAGNWLAMTDDRGGLVVCVIAAREIRELSGGFGDPVIVCHASPDGSMLVTARRSGVLVVWDAATWQQLATADTQGPLSDACWSPGGDRIYAVGGSGAACFDAPPPRPRH